MNLIYAGKGNGAELSKPATKTSIAIEDVEIVGKRVSTRKGVLQVS
jgi:hypothetical protein